MKFKIVSWKDIFKRTMLTSWLGIGFCITSPMWKKYNDHQALLFFLLSALVSYWTHSLWGVRVLANEILYIYAAFSHWERSCFAIYCLFNSAFKLTTRKTSKHHITDHLWRRSNNFLIPLKKDQYLRKEFPCFGVILEIFIYPQYSRLSHIKGGHAGVWALRGNSCLY